MIWTVTQALLNGLITTFEIFIFTLLFALPLTALFALVLGDGSNYWWVAAAIQGESILKVPLCMLRCRKPAWIHDVTIPEGEEP